jgi:hypothetical protein
MFFNSVSQSLRRFLVWYELHDCFHFVRNSLMGALFVNASLSLSFVDSLTHIVCLHLILRIVDVSNTCKYFALIINKVQKRDSQCACSWVICNDSRIWCRLSTEINSHQIGRQKDLYLIDFDHWFKVNIRLFDSSQHHGWKTSDDRRHDSSSILRT